ncbi:CU044_2847 family protein [Streptomyces sp. H39-S7]|uniref:CU044_2847 family protein n=1 Tax=Streptomyces sp. H39-S7 TaxID=3004357 RepID=UPI0022AF154A|nr:CU044_2847 family protein [Streptomyces sp. H39-S7]MCZ4119810.1 CU044_2847 family protein [Streptomyces sp. H39-S7]
MLVSIALPSGREILLPVEGSSHTHNGGSSPDSAGATEGTYDDVSFQVDFSDLVDTAGEIGESLRLAMERIRPRRARVELSVGVDAPSGQIVAFFSDTGASGALKLTLEWEYPTQDPA